MTMQKFAVIAAALAIACVGQTAHADCARPAPDALSLQTVAAQINAVRARAGLPAVQPSQRLARAAQRYACLLARTGTFAHRGPDGSDLRSRVTQAGYTACRAAENLARGHDERSVVPAWLDSPGHRRNLLDAEVRDVGLGVAMDDGRPTIVMVLGRPCGTRA
jgi:uncharacterized protein YkwD